MKVQSRKRIRRMTAAAETVTAYHEAGHAVAAWLLHLGLRRKGISIIRDEDSDGRTHLVHPMRNSKPEIDRSDRNRIRAERYAVVVLAGREAQRRHRGSNVRPYHHQNDYQNAAELIQYFVASHEELEAHLRLLQVRAKNLFENDEIWRCTQAVAIAVLDKKQLSGSEVAEICRTSLGESRSLT